MEKLKNLKHIIKYSLWGLLIGFLVLFLMPKSQLSFNWQSAQDAWQYYQQQTQSELSNTKTKPLSIEDISFSSAVDKASPSVVSINVYREKGLRDSNKVGPDEKIRDVSIGIGSGVILSTQGYIVTNFHVVENANQISISLPDGRRRFVQLIGFDQGSDIAVLKTDIQGLTPAKLATSDTVKTGDIVMAIGNPFALDKQSVSLGIVSAVTLPMSIQTDAAINTGNSGGALINLHGEVIAINQLQLSSRGGGQTGLNYAIPVIQVKRIAEDIILHGRVRQNWFGVVANEFKIGYHQMRYPEIEFGTGFFVMSVDEGSPADKAGLLVNDFITRINHESLTGIASFYRLFYDIPLGKKIELEIIRDGKLINTSVQLIEMLES